MHATGFRNSFTPLPGYFSPFPHGTHPLSVTKEYLGLTGGPARFTRNSTSPTLLGATPHQCHAYSYRTLTHSGTPSQTLHLHATFLTGQSCGSRTTRPPQPRTCNTCRLEHTHGLASSAFARHYSRNHTCFLFLRVLRCFTSPRYHPHPYTFRAGPPDTTPDIPGFPIRTPPDHSSLTNSPGLIAGHNVLHRLLVPRHPPIALHNFAQHHVAQTHTTIKILASTIQFSTTTRTPHHAHTHATQHRTGHHTCDTPQPNSMPSTPPITGRTPTFHSQKLLRKEVIQPHLPVRLPCYDLVLITNPTFDGSPQKVRPPASGVTDFHDLTGGVYKARERIHRSVADLRLLATPTS